MQHIYKIIWEDLPLCGCGNPEAGVALVRDLLKLAPLYEHRDEVDALLPTEGIYYLVLGALTEADLLEHGSGIGGSWLTPKGTWFLQALEALDDFDALDEVGSPHDDCSDLCWTGHAE
jgi:hypothetical protein